MMLCRHYGFSMDDEGRQEGFPHMDTIIACVIHTIEMLGHCYADL